VAGHWGLGRLLRLTKETNLPQVIAILMGAISTIFKPMVGQNGLSAASVSPPSPSSELKLLGAGPMVPWRPGGSAEQLGLWRRQWRLFLSWKAIPPGDGENAKVMTFISLIFLIYIYIYIHI